MSKGYSGMFNGTKGSRVAFGSTDYMKPTDDFSRYIKRRKDADANGFYDIIAHGNPISIEIQCRDRQESFSARCAGQAPFPCCPV